MNNTNMDLLLQWVSPDIVSLFYLTDPDMIMPCNRNSKIVTKKEFNIILKDVMNFYQKYNDKKIEEINIELDKPRNINTSDTVKKKNEKGYIYFIKADNGLVKIGKTINLKDRCKNIKHNNLLETELLFAIKTNNLTKVENNLHKRYENKRYKGEWFSLTKNDIETLKEYLIKSEYAIVNNEIDNE